MSLPAEMYSAPPHMPLSALSNPLSRGRWAGTPSEKRPLPKRPRRPHLGPASQTEPYDFLPPSAFTLPQM